MNKIKLICVLCFLVFGVAALCFDNSLIPAVGSYSSQPPPGMTGAPGEQNCSLCHDEPGKGTITVIAPANYVPGQTYQIQVQHATTDATRMRWGFEATALDETNSAAGTFTDTSPFTQQDFGDGRWYIEHTQSGTFAGTSNGATWTFDWNAPATNIGPVTFYAAGNQANNNHNPSGDHVFLTTSISQPAGTSTPTATPTPTSVPTPSTITSFDSALIAKHVVNSPPLTGNKLGAADVSGNCTVSSPDAAQIANYVTNNSGPIGTTGTTINPPGPCGALPVSTPVLMGDISGTAPVTTAGSGSASVTIPSVIATPASVAFLPINVSDLTGLGVVSYDLHIAFDDSVGSPDPSNPISVDGTLSNAMTVTTNIVNPGHLIISAFGSMPLTGSGVLIQLRFLTAGSPRPPTALTFEDYTDSTGAGSHFHQKFLFNEGTPTVTLTNGSLGLLGFTPTPTPTGTATPTPTGTPSINGTITYGNAIGNPAPPRFVKNVSVASTAGSPPVGPVITGTPGTYTLTGFGAGSYTIKPTKQGGPNGSITSNDAARIAQGVSGSAPFVSQNQRFAADVSANGGVSSNDAALIARYSAGLPTSPNPVGEWKFFVTGAPSPLPTPPQTYNDSRSYPGPVGVQTGQDFVAILIGEVSGNWNPATHARGIVVGGQISDVGEDGGAVEIPIGVTAQPIVTATEKEIVVPVRVEGVKGRAIISYEFDLRYDPSVIQPMENSVDVAGTVSRGLFVVTNPYEPGLLRVVVYGPMPIDENGVLLNLRFAAVGAPGLSSPLTFERVMFNEGEPAVMVSNGMVDLTDRP